MRARSSRIGQGQQCWASTTQLLPDGLTPGHSLTLVAEQGWKIIVRDFSGAEWTVNHWQVERLEFEGQDGVWLDEGESDVLDYLEDQCIAAAGGVGIDLTTIASIL